MSEKEYSIAMLSESFYKRAEKKELKEIMEKENRPYFVFLVKIKGYNFAIPFRTHIRHEHCFKTIPHYENIEENMPIPADATPSSWSGIDYTKAVIIEDNDLEQSKVALINAIEHNMIRKSYRKISVEFKKFVEGYITTLKTSSPITDKYEFTTLINYHKELKIEK